MSVRSLNFTNRHRIPLDAINLTVAEEGANYRISGTVDLSGIHGPEGELIVEVYSLGNRARIRCGSHIGVAPVLATVPRFGSLLTIRCNIRVVSTASADRGKILAAARQFKPEIEGDASGREGILDFVPADLGQVLWVMEYGPDQEPQVLVNQELNWQAFVKTNEFRHLVMPEIARGAARWVWQEKDNIARGDNPTGDGWAAIFRRAGADLSEYSEDDDAERDWVNAAVKSFANKHRFLESWLGLEEEE